LNIFARPRFERAPCFFADRRWHQLLAHSHERVARALGGDFLRGLVRLRVLAGMTGQPRHEHAQQHWTFATANCSNRVLDHRGRGARIGAIPFQDLEIAERGEIGGNVAARGLEIGLHGNAVAVVFQEEQHRQALGRRNRQSRPEAVGCSRSFAAVRNRNAADSVVIAQNLSSILQRLGPTDGRRVLRADAATGRQYARAFTTRQIEHDSDVATFADAAGPHHRRSERIFYAQAERQHQRPRTVIHADPIAGSRQHLTQQRLRDVVATGGELVEHLALRQQARLLQLIEGTRDQHCVGGALPIDLGRSVRSGTFEGSCGHGPAA